MRSNLTLTRPATLTIPIAMMSLVSPAVLAEPTRATFPDNLDELTHYTTVHRRDITEHIMTSLEAIKAMKADQPAPHGTRFVLVDYRNNEIYRLFVMEKGQGWGQQYADNEPAGDWHFQWYWPDGSIKADEDTARCRNCHNNRNDDGYLFTYDELMDYQHGG
jgi:hypothetical protein